MKYRTLGKTGIKVLEEVKALYPEMAGLVIGAQVPILINSRADDALTRLRSVAMAALLAHRKVAKEKANGS